MSKFEKNIFFEKKENNDFLVEIFLKVIFRGRRPMEEFLAKKILPCISLMLVLAQYNFYFYSSA